MPFRVIPHVKAAGGDICYANGNQQMRPPNLLLFTPATKAAISSRVKINAGPPG
jgi:hypothetical protein